MKARMLCVLVSSAFLMTPFASDGKERLDFGEAIEESQAQATESNRKVVRDLSRNETLAFYNADWLNLRKRKKRALASADLTVRLKKEVAKNP